MTDGDISVRDLEANNPLFTATASRVQRLFVDANRYNMGNITKWDDFIPLYTETAEFNRTFFPELWNSYIPIYNTVWRQSLDQPPSSENIHQDETVIHFSGKALDSRMFNLWVCLSSTLPSTLRNGELGIFVIDSDCPENKPIYDRLKAKRTHFILKRGCQLVDNSHVGGAVLPLQSDELSRRAFPFKTGTAVLFNSHLLHGTCLVPDEYKARREDLSGRGRTALTSVWVHRDDFNFSLLDVDEDRYEDFYLGIHGTELRELLKTNFSDECSRQKQSFSTIASLARHHLGMNER